MVKKRFQLELYESGETGAALIKDWTFDTKAEQLEKYYGLIARGYKRAQIEKFTMNWYL